RNATQRNATQRNATQRNATQRNATQRLSYALTKSSFACVYTFSAHIQHFITYFLQHNTNLLTIYSKQTDYGHMARNRFFAFLCKLGK
ncbi:hypothetical protein ACI76O_02895, partial [Capnocytophaga cynodegmi]|uniref:hypothetical protein n=1 Tax=Capnocytophaga cynodegmi TaxID=28189 RepID=UPI00385FF7F9